MTDTLVVRCGRCQQRFKVKRHAQDVRIQCTKCGAVMRIKGSAAQPSNQPAGDISPATGRGVADRSGPSRPVVSSPLNAPAQHPLSPHPGNNFYPGNVGAMQPAARKKSFPTWLIVLIGALVVVPILMCGGIGLMFSKSVRNAKARAQLSRSVLPPAAPDSDNKGALNIPLPAMPELGSPDRNYPSGETSYFLRLPGPEILPAGSMQLRVFLPAGEHADQSVPCVLVAPAGTTLLHGASLSADEQYDAETLPYAQAGFAVVQYSLDGAMPSYVNENDQLAMVQAMSRVYPAFRRAGAGVANGRRALEFALTRLKMVDPKRISTAGHSSAGNVSLLLAAAEPRISRCVAYAAAYDFQNRMGDMASDPDARRLFPHIETFIPSTSPINHVRDFHCPVFVFHARDDSNVPYADAQKFVKAMQDAGKQVTFKTAPQGDHYQPMIDVGIPAAIEWLKQSP